VRDYFQALRGIACLMVLWNHVGPYLLQGVDQSYHWFTPIIAPAGFPWVWLFLTLSGFLLTKAFATGRFALNRIGIAAFYMGRACRLLPLMWFAGGLWITLFYVAHLWPTGWTVSPRRELLIALAAPWLPYSAVYHPIGSANSPVWSAVIEIHFSLALPLALLFLRPLYLSIGLAAWSVAVALLFVAYVTWGSPNIFPMIYQQHLYNAGFFLGGVVVAMSPMAMKQLRRVPRPLAFTAFGVAVYVTLSVAQLDVNMALATTPLLMLPAIMLLVATCDCPDQMQLPLRFSQLWGGGSPLAWLQIAGAMSYSIYLLHRPISFILMDRLGAREIATGYPSMFLVGGGIALVIIALSSLSYIYVEMRFRYRRC
jgi:peptidoglycan/LPS O-acetylase OafA/YrhL